jgi:flavodoxin
MLYLLFILLLVFPSLQIDQSKTIIIYFSRAGYNYNVGKVDKGNTEMIVEYLKTVTDIDTYKIIPETAYPEDYDETVAIARNEKSSNERPVIKDPLTDISKYDTILLGYPIWHGDLPNIVMTQLEMLDFEGKTIYPFNTHEGSRTGNSINDIKTSAPKADVKDGFALRGTDARKTSSHENIRTWLKDQLNIDISNSTVTTDDDEEEEEDVENIQVYKNSKYCKVSYLSLLSALFFF